MEKIPFTIQNTCTAGRMNIEGGTPFIFNATSIQSIPIYTSTFSEGDILVYDNIQNIWSATGIYNYSNIISTTGYIGYTGYTGATGYIVGATGNQGESYTGATGPTGVGGYNGNLLWSTNIDGIDDEYTVSRGICSDSENNTYVNGYSLSSTVNIYNKDGSIFKSITPSTTPSSFLVKYDSSGFGVWGAYVEGGDAKMESISLDSTGNIYITSYYTTAINIYNENNTLAFTVSSSSSSTYVLIKYNNSGYAQWVSRIDASDMGVPIITNDKLNNVYLSSNYDGNPLTLYNSDGSSFQTITSSDTSIFVVKYTTDGIGTWVTQFIGTDGYTGGLLTDTNNNVYISGKYGKTFTAYNSDGTLYSILPAPSVFSMFTLKYNSLGFGTWTVFGVGSGYGFMSTAMDRFNNIYIFDSLESNNSLTLYNKNGVVYKVIPSSSNGGNYIVKYNENGFGVWCALSRTTSYTVTGYITVDDNVYVLYSSPTDITFYNSDNTVYKTLYSLYSGVETFFVLTYSSDGFIQDNFKLVNPVMFSFRPMCMACSHDLYLYGFSNNADITLYNSDNTPIGYVPDFNINYGCFLLKIRNNKYSDYLYWNSDWDTGKQNVNIGNNAGELTSNLIKVNIGNHAGYANSNDYNLSIGSYAGYQSPNIHSCAIGNQAGYTNQGSYSIAIGNQAGYENSGTHSITICGKTNQGVNSIAIGNVNNQGTDSIAIGQSVLINSSNSIGIGKDCYPDEGSISIGYQAGLVQGTYCIAIGSSAGLAQNNYSSIAIGQYAGYFQQGSHAVAIGQYAGYWRQGENGIAIGTVGSYDQQPNAIAIGTAGLNTQGANSIAIGKNVAITQQGVNSIIIGTDIESHATNTIAMGKNITIATQSGFYINPIRSTSLGSTPILTYDSNNEVVTNSSKSFVINHPLDPEKYLVHACIEGAETGIFYRGKGKITSSSTTIHLPVYATKLANEFTVIISPLDRPIKIAKSLYQNGSFQVYAEEPCEFHWFAIGNRCNIEAEVDKNKITVCGTGPYKWFENI